MTLRLELTRNKKETEDKYIMRSIKPPQLANIAFGVNMSLKGVFY